MSLDLGMEKCFSCQDGTVPGRRPCSSCKGTRRGPRGGRNGCTDCISGTELDWDNPVTCERCNGTGQIERTLMSFMDSQTVRNAMNSLAFRLRILDNTQMSFNESYIGAGKMIMAVTDYGRAYDRVKDRDPQQIEHLLTEIRDELINDTTIQYCKIYDRDANLCDHIEIIMRKNGYSIRPSYTEDGSDVVETASREIPKEVGMIYGMMVAENGGNGTMAAATDQM